LTNPHTSRLPSIYTDALDEDLVSRIERNGHKIVMFLLKWWEKNKLHFPWRENRTPYRILVAEVILRRTTAKAALRVYDKILKSYPDIEALRAAKERDLATLLSTVGFHKQRSKVLKAMASYIVKEHRGQIPSSREELLKIPHVGPYTAGAIRSLGYNMRSAMVDSNVRRIVARLFLFSLCSKPTYRTVAAIVETILPKEEYVSFDLALLDLGITFCRSVRPLCLLCPLSGLCDFGGNR
jgi:A/G-specific adenine glycosylase